ncbi:MAG: hypothetical protein JOZ81_35090 [Chloroflexi bacterium]|nr:hypothetical protein [Chloroflexota bacterium]MBV9543254.1 hypothetical protein [Chloroflexota bacterium]
MASAFDQAIQPWHEFYTLMGSSSATLLGLLFVSVSMHLDALTGDARLLAHETFSQFFLLLLLAAICLVPGLAPPLFGLALLLLGSIAAVRQVRHRLRPRVGFPHPWRRDLFPALAYVVLLGTGIAAWVTGAAPMHGLLAVSLLLISQATLNAWEMLVYLGARTHATPSDAR